MSKIRALLNILDKIVCVLTSKQRKNSLVAFCAMVVASIFELLGVSVIVPFMSILMNSQEETDLYIKKVHLEWIDEEYILLYAGLFLLMVYIIKNILLLYSRYVQNKYILNLQSELSNTVLCSYLKRPYEFFVNTDAATVIRGVEGDVSSFCEEVKQFFSLLAEGMTVLLIVVYVFITDWITACSVTLIALVSVLAIVLGFKTINRRLGEMQRESAILKEKAIYETILGIKDIFVMNRQRFFGNRYATRQKKYCHDSLIFQTVGQIPERIMEIILVGGLIVIVCIRLLAGYDSSQFIPQLAALAVASFRLLPSLNKISNSFAQIVFHEPGLNSVYDNMSVIEKKNVGEMASKVSNQYEIQTENSGNLIFNQELSINNISWKYSGNSSLIIENLSLNIKKGQAIALIGKSGAGKTTLADVILGLLKPQEGNVFVDGIDVYNYPAEWAKLIGYVPQSVFLLDDTIRNNIVFGLSDDSIDDDKIWKVLEQAQLSDFVKKLPNGLETVVGERGIRFSGGQRQRLAIARMLFFDPQIVVLDEATSALDDSTEASVMKAIDALRGNKTMIIIAHRLSTLRNCDYIYEIKDGKAHLIENKEALLKWDFNEKE